MTKFFIAAALGLGLLAAGGAAQAQHMPQPGVTQVHYQGGHYHRHYAPPPRHHHHHRYAPPPPPRHYGWHAPQHRPYRQYGWR